MHLIDIDARHLGTLPLFYAFFQPGKFARVNGYSLYVHTDPRAGLSLDGLTRQDTVSRDGLRCPNYDRFAFCE